MPQVAITVSIVVLALSLTVLAGLSARRLVGWWRFRAVRREVAEDISLSQTRAYVAWVRNMPPPPPKFPPPPVEVPQPVRPRLRGKWRPFAGRRMAGN